MSLSITPSLPLPVDLSLWPVVASLSEYIRDQVESFTLAHDWYYFIIKDNTVWRTINTEHDHHLHGHGTVDTGGGGGNFTRQMSGVYSSDSYRPLTEVTCLAGKGVWKILPDTEDASYALDREGRLWTWVVVAIDFGLHDDNNNLLETNTAARRTTETVVQQVELQANGNAIPPVADFSISDGGIVLLTKLGQVYASPSGRPLGFLQLDIENACSVSFWSFNYIFAINHDKSLVRFWDEQTLDPILPLSMRTFTLSPIKEILAHQLHDFVLTADGKLFVFTNHRHLMQFEHEYPEHSIRTIFTNFSKIFVQLDDGNIYQIVTIVGHNRKLYPVPGVRCFSDLWVQPDFASGSCSLRVMLTLRLDCNHLATTTSLLASSLVFRRMWAAYSLHEHMRSLFNNPARSDLRVRFNGYPPIFVHRGILRFHSDYWCLCLANTWQERQSEYRPSTYNFEIYYLYLKFIYTHHIEWMSFENALDLIDIGKCYLEPSLLEFCINFLVENYLNESNCLFLYQFGDHYQLPTLCTSAAYCIRDNWASIDMETLDAIGDDERTRLMVGIFSCTMDQN